MFVVGWLYSFIRSRSYKSLFIQLSSRHTKAWQNCCASLLLLSCDWTIPFWGRGFSNSQKKKKKWGCIKRRGLKHQQNYWEWFCRRWLGWWIPSESTTLQHAYNFYYVYFSVRDNGRKGWGCLKPVLKTPELRSQCQATQPEVLPCPISLAVKTVLLFFSSPFGLLLSFLFIKPPPRKEKEVIVKLTKAVSHLLQWLLDGLNLQQEGDEAERKRGEKEMQEDEFNRNTKLNVSTRERERKVIAGSPFILRTPKSW